MLVLIQSCNHCPYVLGVGGADERDPARLRRPRRPVVAVNSNDASRYPATRSTRCASARRAQGFDFDYLHDEDQSLARALGAERTPEVFVFDRDRRLVYHGAIDDSRDDDASRSSYLRDALDAVLARRRPAVAETPPVGCTVKWRD